MQELNGIIEQAGAMFDDLMTDVNTLALDMIALSQGYRNPGCRTYM